MERGNRKSRIGVVVSNKMTKTVVVKVERRVPDAKYGKIVKQRREVQGARREPGLPDRRPVRIVETRPMSKDKRWRVAETLEKAAEV